MVVETIPKDILDKLNAGIELSNVDFDIRDLTSVSDSVEVMQDTFANCKVEAHSAAGEVILTGAYGWDGGFWETLNTDGANRLLVAATGTFWQATQPVSGTFWQATQPVSGTFWQATQPVSGTFYPVTQPVSATDLDIRNLTAALDVVTTVETKATTMAYNAVSITSAVTSILSSHSTRTGFIIVNAGAQTVYLGGNAVTTASGIPLEIGASYSNQDWTGAFYGRVAAGTCDVRIEEFY